MMNFYVRKMVFCLLFVLPVSVYLSGQNNAAMERDWKTDRQVLQVISYNIFNGFDWGKDTERQERWVAWIREQQPDVLALQELCGFTEEKLLQLAQSYGHTYVAIVKEEGYPVGITSRYPIEKVEKRVTGYGHGLLHARILDLDFLVTHLNPSDWRTRREEAANIVAYMQAGGFEKALVMGDLNALSPVDATILESRFSFLKGMMDDDMKNKNGKANFNNGHPDYSVISAFLAASLHDICQQFVEPDQRYTFPTTVLVGTPKGAAREQLKHRLDYIFATDALRPYCVDAYIYNNDDTGYLSDHYPVGVRLLLP